jgi:hypothetical protein
MKYDKTKAYTSYDAWLDIFPNKLFTPYLLCSSKNFGFLYSRFLFFSINSNISPMFSQNTFS